MNENSQCDSKVGLAIAQVLNIVIALIMLPVCIALFVAPFVAIVWVALKILKALGAMP